MDKASVALAATEDNAAAIRELSKQFARKTSCRLLDSKLNDEKYASFGNVTSDGSVGVVVKFSGTSTALVFCGNIVNTGVSPIIAVLPAGSGELMLGAARAANALIIGGS